MVGRREQGRRRRELQARERRALEEEEEREEEEREAAAMAVVAAEKEKEKEKGKEKEGEKFGQQFFRLFLPQQYGERLRIPPSFHQYLQNQPTGVVSLKGQSGNTWLAELVSNSEGLFFENGWKEFVRDHSIEMGDLLTFRYDGCSQFSVVVFDGMCIEKPSAFHAKPCKDLVVKLENDEGDMGMNAADPSEILAAPLEQSNETTRKMNKEMDANGSTLKKCSNVLEKGKNKGPGASVGPYKGASTSLNMDTNAADQSEVAPLMESYGTTRKRIRRMDVTGSTSKKCSNVLENGKEKRHGASVVTYKETSTSLNMDMIAPGPSEILVVPLEESNGATRKRVREMDANGSTLRKSSRVSQKGKKELPGASIGTHKSASTSLKSTEDSDSSSIMLEESISCIKSAKSSHMLLKMNKDVVKHGKNIATSQRQPAVISQRPPVTEEQKNLALQKAKKFKSKNPFALQIMKESYVYVGFFMNIPCEFVRECLPHANKKLKLWDPQGKAWEVNYVYYSQRSVGAFSGGWSKFSLGNHLEKFDVCVFELLSKDNIKVHIYRVVPEIIPFLPGSNRK